MFLIIFSISLDVVGNTVNLMCTLGAKMVISAYASFEKAVNLTYDFNSAIAHV